MLNRKALLTSALVIAGGANAVSSGCGTGVAGLALGDLGSCLQLTSVLPLLTGNNNNQSIITTLNIYLSSLCASSTPACSNSTLQSAQYTINSSCSSDIQAGGSDAAFVNTVQTILQNYDHVYAAACSRNSTTNDFCVVHTLENVQNVTRTDVTTDTLTGVLSGSSGSDSLNQALQSGQLCNGCVQEIYYQTLQANQSIATSSFGQSINQACGSNFDTAPSGVSTANPSATSNAASQSSSGATDAALRLPGWKIPLLAGGLTALVGTVIGAAAIL